MGLRRIRPGGRVRWLGRWFALESGSVPVAQYAALPLEEKAKHENSPAYDGRMDGRVGLFYTYGNHHEGSKTHIYLHNVENEWPGPSCVGGVFHWETFRLVNVA